jgi:phosphoribosyl 1,2-cyclic phosphodiesterase
MRVRFWGTRGSIPTPGQTTVRFGGNTACVELRTAGGTLFIFDSGTGIRELGLQLSRSGHPVDAHLLLGHTHWDHIAGFPFFSPAFAPGNRLTIYGARGVGRPLREVIAGQMHATYFPVPLRDLRAAIDFRELDEGQYAIGDATVQTLLLNHTTRCMGYRIDTADASMAYITDHEPFGPPRNGHLQNFSHAGDRRLIDFVRGVDLLIQDAQYTAEEYLTHLGWGHGSADYVADVAIAAGVHQAALFHHEPTHPDEQIDQILAAVRQRAARQGSSVHLFAAAEGQELSLPDPSTRS